MTDVWWVNRHLDECHPRPTWDVQLLQEAMAGTLWPSIELPPFAHHEGPGRPDGMTGGVVLIPGGFHHRDNARICEDLAGMEWAVVMVVSDEGSLYPTDMLALPERNRLWVMTPRPDRYYPPDTRFIGEGWPTGTRETVARHGNRERTWDVTFAGQVNHERRQGCWTALESLDGPKVQGWRSAGFAQGLDRDTYLDSICESRIVACPAGPRTPDSFRAYEAFEAGAVPILDQTAPNYPARGYWPMVLPGCPAPLIGEWSELGKYVDAILSDWAALSAGCQAWWLGHKRWMVATLADDLAALDG